ncbi:MAG: LysR family transcriptional regulator [Pseudomonadota bacterium]
MDITLARTFLEINACRSFAQAAERLHITQTAVSARIKTLESLLGRRLFVRNKAGAVPTPAGEQFVRHALNLVQTWERARSQMAVARDKRALVAVGCEVSLWEPLMLEWMKWMRVNAADLALQAEVDLAEDLLGRVSNGTLDIAIVYAPRQRPGLRIDLLIEEKLILVSSAPDVERLDPASYVYVDWAPEFATQQSLAFPELGNAPVSTNLGPLGLGYLLAVGGSGYFRENVVAPHIRAGRLHKVSGAPTFVYPAYAVYAQSADMKTLAPALAGLKHAAGSQSRRKVVAGKRKVRNRREDSG